ALLPGGVLVGVGAQVLHMVSVYYLGSKITSASEMYGSLGAAAAIIAWLYLIGRLFVASAMLDATMWERAHPEPDEAARPPAHHPFDGPVLTLGGDGSATRRAHALVRDAPAGEDGHAQPR